MKRFWKLFLSVSVILLFVTACSEEATPNTHSDSDQLHVVTSIFPMYEIVKEVAGDRADVSLMVGANEDAHHYEPSAQAVASVNEADIFVYSSENMEFWVSSLLDVVENDTLEIVEFSKGLDLELEESDHSEALEDLEDVEEHGHKHDDVDPHFWLNPLNIKDQLPLIVNALTVADPEGEKDYTENAEKFSQSLTDLDRAYTEAFLDAKQRTFVVQHQAFGHLADHYDLDQVAVGGLSTEIETSPQALSKIIDFVNEQNVPVIYYQSGDQSATAEAIAKETGTDIAVLYDLESKPADLESEENLYLEAMAKNLEELKKAIR